MKKILLSLSAIAFLSLPAVKAQYINPDFETWTHNAGPPAYDDPNTGLTNNGWQELNFTSSALAGSSPISVFKDSTGMAVTPYHGKYCAEITTVKLSSTTVGLLGKLVPDSIIGIIFTGSVNLISGKGALRIPFTQAPANYNFWYQYDPVGVDTASCSVIYTRNDTVIAAGKTDIIIPQNTWKQATVTVFTVKSGLPDSISIIYNSSGTHAPKVGSTFYIDDATNTGIPSIFGNDDNVVVYPNPAKNEINLKVSGDIKADKAEVYDITGKLINAYSFYTNTLTINTQQLSTGIYFYKIFDNTGIQLKVGKFSVVR